MASNEKTTRARKPLDLPVPLLVTGLIVACAAACWLGIVAGRPFVLAGRMRQENAGVERRLMDMRMDTQNMRKDVAALSTDTGMERQARQRGYVKPGEQLLMIPPPAK
jgi:hypothetical protein